MSPPLDVCLDRVENRRGHGSTDLDAAKHRWREFRDADIDPRHLDTDDHQRPAEKARVLAERVRAGTLLASAP